MNENNWFFEENLLYPLTASTREEAISQLGGLLLKNGYVKEHGLLGAPEAEKILRRLNSFSDEEIEIVKYAITYHSDKKTKHDKYSELLKDADVLQNSLYNTSFEIKHLKRLKKVFKSFGVKMKLKKLKDKKPKPE